MITETDSRVYTPSKYENEFRKAINAIYDYAKTLTRKEVGEYEYGGYRARPKLVMYELDKYMQPLGFEVDARECKHAYGIGNNNEWIIRDNDLVQVGELHCTNDMFGGVIMYITIFGKRIKRDSVHI